MDDTEVIQKFKEFIENEYYEELMEHFRTGKKYLVIDFKLLNKQDRKLGELLLDRPEEAMKGAELAIFEFEIPKNLEYFKIRLKNLPNVNGIDIRAVRCDDIGKMHSFEAVIRRKSDVRPLVTKITYECPSCGNIISILQIDKKIRKPTRCGCGRKGKFTENFRDRIDAQSVTLEEIQDNLPSGTQPKRIQALLKQDLVSLYNDGKTNPGTKIKILGHVRPIPISVRNGGTSTKEDIMIEANNVEVIDESIFDIKLNKKDQKQIEELSKDPEIYIKLIESIAPSTKGHELIKEALLLQLFGGVQKKRKDGVTLRGDTHILLIGEPGTGKSQLLKRMCKISPNAQYTSGKGTSGCGLTATVVKDELLGGWTLEAGALVLAHKGMIGIDELDKMGKEDRSHMHEALEQQQVSINKAGIQATLPSMSLN